MAARGVSMEAGLRNAVIALADAAAARILEVYATAFEVAPKADASPVTAADLAAHHCIVAGLQALTPEIPVLSEESADEVPAAVRRRWSRLWVVDPLDGTREFIKRNGEFAINIALVENGVATFGLIQQPVTGTLWHGAPGRGAFRRQGGREVAIGCRRPAMPPLQVAGSRSHRDRRTQTLIARIGRADVIGLGASLKFCRLAEGAIDVYPRFGPTSEWDTAAGQAIVEAAGGVLLDPDGRPFRYNQRDHLLNGRFIALGDPDLPWRHWLLALDCVGT